MQTYLEMQTELTSRLGVATNSTKFPPSRIQTLIKDSHLWATALFPFRSLTRPKTSLTFGDENYDYPPEYRDFSIWAIYIDGNLYRKKRFENWLEYKRNNPSGTKRLFADMARQFFVFPLPAEYLTINIYGQQEATQFSADGDMSIFSKDNDEGNEAIILRAEGVALNNPNKTNEAISLLTKIFSDEQDRQQRDQVVDAPMFNVPDFFGGGQNPINSNWSNHDPDEEI